MPRLALYLLGTPRVELDGELVRIGRRKAVALLAFLAVTEQPHSRDTLATLLWPGYDQTTARAHLRRALATLSKRLGRDWFATEHETIGLRQAPSAKHHGELVKPSGQTPLAGSGQALRLDVAAFRQRLAVCDAHDHPPEEACESWCESLAAAVELYRDDFMAGFTLPDSPGFDEWQRYQALNLRDELGSVLERLSACYTAQSDYEPAIAAARRWLALDPLCEAAHRCLMRLYAFSGQQPAVLRQFQQCQLTLKEELGVPPSAQTVELMERIRAGESLEQVAEGEANVPHNLPPQPTPFVGRERELAELGKLIANPDVRLVTIVGPGGIGKTRLALAVAERQLNSVETSFLDGVHFVALAGLSVSDEMAPAVAEALGFQLGGPGDSRSARQRVLDYLREKRMLLVLDNFEHLLRSPADDVISEGPCFVADVLHTAPRVQLLVTSRERLPLREEQAFLITGLEYAGEESDDAVEYAAEQLFLQAARRAERSFELATDEAACLSHICRLLEGMPLAIELAAAWADTLSLADIGAEIQGGLDFLAAEWQDVPARHRSVGAAFDASWRRLTEAEQAVFAQLCVFRGGFTREAAREVAGADFRTLARLADKSLLSFNRERERYEVHELLRQYGRGRLAEDPAREVTARDRHSAFYCAALGNWYDALNRRRKGEEVIDLGADLANVWAAWEEAARQANVARLDQAMDGLYRLVRHSGRMEEGAALFRLACDGLRGNTATFTADGQRVLARALLYCSDVNASMGRWGVAGPMIQQSKKLLEDLGLAALDTRAEWALLHVMMGWQAVPDCRKQKWHYEQALILERELGREGEMAYRLMNTAVASWNLGELDNTRQKLEESLALFRALGDAYGIARQLGFLGALANTHRDYATARARCGEALSFARAYGMPVLEALNLRELGWSLFFEGDFQASAHNLQESVAVWRRLGDRQELWLALTRLSRALLLCGECDQAYAHAEEAMALAEEIEGSAALCDVLQEHAQLDLATSRYASARAYAQQSIEALSRGFSASDAQEVLGWVALAEGDYEEAGQTLIKVMASLPESASKAESQGPRARALAVCGGAARGLGHYPAARRHLVEALEIAVQIREFPTLLHVMPSVPVVFADEDDPRLQARAVELYALATSHPFVAKAQLFEDIAWRQIRAATASLPPDVIAAAQERGRALDWWETAEALLEELPTLWDASVALESPS